MTYKINFKRSAKKEWDKLGATIREQFRKKILERCENPRVEGDRLRGHSHLYKIKLKSAGYRLVYSVDDEAITITVIAVGKREKDEVYRVVNERS